MSEDIKTQHRREQEQARMTREAEQLHVRLQLAHKSIDTLIHACYHAGPAVQTAAMDELLASVGDLSSSFTAARELRGDGIAVQFRDPDDVFPD